MKHIRQLQDRVNLSVPRRWALTLLLCLLSGAGWAAVARLIDSQSLWSVAASLNDGWFWLTALFLALLTLTIALLTHSLFTGALILGVGTAVLAFVNYFKVLITSIPLTIGEFSLIGRVGNIVALNIESITFSPISILAILAALAWLAVMWFFSRPLRISWKRSALGGLAGLLVFVLVFWVGLNPLVLTPLQADSGQFLSQTAANKSCGMVLGLWRALFIQAAGDLEDDYSAAAMERVAAQAEEYAAGQSTPVVEEQPNVILILSESFFDITTLEGVTYREDPVADFHALQKEGVSGTFYTRSLGYGTCNIELEILTGMNTGLLSGEDLYAWDPEVFSRLPTVPGLFRDSGYYTAMLHTFNDSIYHRADIFDNLGFDNLYFSGDFAQFYDPAAQADDYWDYMNRHISGRFYSDELLSQLFISLYEKRKEQSDGPVFLYGISMENHSSYVDEKYPQEQLTVDPRSSLTGEAAEQLLYMSQGVSNASRALGELTDYFRTVDEPIVIIFYGDHRPGLGLASGGTVYSRLGMVSADKSAWTLEDYAQFYSTDYLIWSNDPAYLPGEPGSAMDSSCNYLGAEILDLAGVEKPLYWKLISQLSETRSIDSSVYRRDADGALSFAAPTGDRDALGLDLLAQIIRDAVYGDQFVTEKVG